MAWTQFCTPWCLAAIVLALSSVFVTANACGTAAVKSLQAALGPQQREIYENIVSSRLRIYLTGSVIGFLLACAFLFFKTRAGQALYSPLSLCQLVVIFEVIQYLYYMLAPKPELMVVSLGTEKLREKWAAAYRSMQLRHYVGFGLALAAVVSGSAVAC